MTHARTPETTTARPRHSKRAHDRPSAEIRHDPEALADRRRLADALPMLDLCGRPECRRAGRCSGPAGATAAFPGEALPACLAEGFETMYAPVARWTALMEKIDEVLAKARARGLLDPPAGRPGAPPSPAFETPRRGSSGRGERGGRRTRPG